MTTKHKAQRVGVFVDVQNLYYSARSMYNAKVNFKEILKEAVKGRVLVRAIAYVIKADMQHENVFHDMLETVGFEVKAKDLQVFYGGQKKGDWDVGITIDCVELAPKLDVVVLISGDGDYVPLVEHLEKAMGCRVEVMAFGRSASGKLKEAAFEFVDLDKDKRKYLISSGMRQRGRRPERQEPAAAAQATPEQKSI